jgi:hypothetical protein
MQAKAAPQTPAADRQPAHLRAVLSAAQAKGLTRAPAVQPTASRPARFLVVQRAAVGVGELGFAGLAAPAGYGAVSLRATVNGFSVGDAWSREYKFTEDTEHAEDAVVDFLEFCVFWIKLRRYPPDASATLRSVIDSMAQHSRAHVAITDLTASPCSSERGTCKKRNISGCTDRLIGLKEFLAGSGFQDISISVSADHYYQPQGIDEAKAKSQAAKADLEKAGISVAIARP